jgi:hypothetical protein
VRGIDADGYNGFMRSRGTPFIIALACVAVSTACSSSPTAPPSAAASPLTSGLAPAPTAPTSNAAVGLRPRFVVTNVAPLGVPAGIVIPYSGGTAYWFEISPTQSFGSLLASGTVNEEVGQTSFSPSSDLPLGELYWRARAQYSNGLTGPFTSTQTFHVVPASTYIDPPTVIGPLNGIDVEIRARFNVWNARSPNPLAALIYRFDVSRDPSLTPVVSTTVAEGNAVGGMSVSTTAALSPELSFDTTYSWRAQAIDRQSGAASAFTPFFTFKTHGPLPGLAMLHVSLPACRFGLGVTFDGTLTSDGTVARFVDSSHRFGPPDLTLDLSRTADGWSGRALGNGKARDGDEVHILPPTGQTAALVRATEVAGQFSGTFDGTVAIWNSFGDGGGPGCSDEFKFVILPPK